MPPMGNNGAGYSAIAPKQIMKIEVDYGDDHNGGDCREGEQKRWKGKEMNGIPMFPERNWNYLHSTEYLCTANEITSLK